jgi:Cysteine-rich CPCC
MENKCNRYGKFQCPCCEYYTLDEQPNNTFQLCPVCYWEDDGVQLNDPEYEGGANRVSLNQARINFKKNGVSELQFKRRVRLPFPMELSAMF